jgi:hypothetical protein
VKVSLFLYWGEGLLGGGVLFGGGWVLDDLLLATLKYRRLWILALFIWLVLHEINLNYSNLRPISYQYKCTKIIK